MGDSAFPAAIALRIAKWELMFAGMHNAGRTSCALHAWDVVYALQFVREEF